MTEQQVELADHHLGIGAVAVERELISRRSELSHQVLTVDRILRAAQRNDVYLLHTLLFLLGKERIYKLAAVEHPELVDALANTDISYGNVELVADANHNASLGRAVQLGDR